MRWRGRARDWERQKLRERERLVDFKKLAHTVMKADNYKICWVRQRLRPRQEPELQFTSKSHLLSEFPVAWDESVFCSTQASK